MPTPQRGRTHRGALASLPPLPPRPLVSVVIPALNEERYIGALLESLEAQTYPPDRFEVVVSDGGSKDSTREIIRETAARWKAPLRLVENPAMLTPQGLNAGVEAAAGDVIIILGGHSLVDPRFIEESVIALQETGAAVAGGVIEARGEGRLANAIAAALSHPFGVGDARFRFSTRPGYVDTIAFAAYRRECFELLGGFDTDRHLAVDDFYNFRVRDAGGRLYLTPAVRSVYYTRTGLRPLAKQYFGYGRAKGRASVEVPPSIQPRHLVPAATIAAASLLLLASRVSRSARWLFILGGVAYGGLNAASSASAASRRGDRTLGPLIAGVFPLIHASYGVGMILGAISAASHRFGNPMARLWGREPGTGPLASLPPLPPLPLVSVVIPALNEARHIGALLDSLEAQTYPTGAFEVIVADGGSTDGTREIVAEASRCWKARLQLIDNPAHRTPQGLNTGIAAARGQVIVTLGAHSLVDARFIEESVSALQQSGAAAAGGVIEARGEGRVATAIAAALSHPFGVGDARFRFAKEPAYVDTIAFAAYRRECFDLLGGFDTDRQFAEDDFFNFRVRAAGGRLYLSPAVRSVYYTRTQLRPLIKQYFAYGRAKGRSSVEVPASIQPRHLVPAATVAGGALLLAASSVARPARWMLALGTGAYGAMAVYSATTSAARRHDRKLAPVIGAVLPVVHASYGMGTLAGAAKALWARRQRR